MYKFGDNQISFSDFGQPVGMKMNPNNRWVKKAETIPWKECELRYAHLFRNKKGNVAKPLRLALGACIIQAEYGYSKPRTYRKQAHKEYLKLARCKHPTSKKIRQAVKKQLGYLSRNIVSIQTLLEHGASLTQRRKERFQTIAVLFSQQQHMFMNHTHRVAHRIVSLAQPFLEPIVRGKARTPVEFGPNLEISVVDGWTYLEQYSFRSYNEAHSLKQMVLSFFNRTGHYPRRVLADKIYRTRENLQFCKVLGIRLSGPALGRPKKGEARDKKQDYKDEADRVEVERKFSLAKRKCGLGLIMTKLEDTVAHTLALSVLVLNLRKAVKCRPDLRACLVCLFLPIRKWEIVQ